jgi:16S rRNA G966 N2-methylase RsmD
VVGIELSHTHIGYIKKVCSELDVKNYFLQKADVFKYLESAKGNYDIVFADPPYAIKDLDKLPDLVLNKGLLNEGGIFILEHGRDYDFSAHPHFLKMRKYGNVHFSFFANAKNS